VTAPTPLLDFFKKGEVPRDVRRLAAQGGLQTRAHEQLAILVVLVDDPDAEVRGLAESTLNRIPVESLQKFLGRSDVSIGLREFFADRGVFPDEIPSLEPAIDIEPLVPVDNVESVESLPAEEFDENEDRETAVQRVAKMGFTERLKAAVKGTREMRGILIRDPNKMIAAAVLSSPKLAEPEVEAIARMTNVSDEVLRIIANNRAWTKNYGILLALVKNPKTPVAMSMNMMARLNDRDLSQLSVDRNVPEPLRVAARKKVVAGASGRR
jgi:hypothetical protein